MKLTRAGGVGSERGDTVTAGTDPNTADSHEVLY